MATEFATRSLEDKSSHVRRNAVKLLGRLIQTHPFSVMHGGQIARKDWRERLEAVDRELEELSPPIGSPGLAQRRTSTATIDEALIEEATQVDPSTPKLPVELSEEAQAAAVKRATETAATSEALGRLKLTRRYYVEALRFIDVLYEASKKVCQLLSSKNKSEVIEAMDFFVTADAYRLEPARIGIRKMLCLIWTKGNSDEGKGVQNHVIECYKGLFFDAPDGLSANDAANYVARNMISLTFGATSAELTSLEQLLSTMQTTKLVSDLVITKLWQVYGVQRREISRTQRRGAIIVLGMLALADPSIVLRETETMLAVGLGQHGTEDFCLARYTCIALRRIHAAPKSAKQAQSSQPRLPADHLILKRLVTMLELESDSQEWYCMAEHAVSAVYALAQHPDDMCSELIRRRTKSVFSVGRKGPQGAVSSSDPGMEVSQVEVSSATLPVSSPPKPSVASLSQLLFLVGHIAIKQIVHLELCEQDFKRRKAAKELILQQQQQQQQQQRASSPKKRPLAAVPTASPPPNEQQNELDLIGGTSEDDFSDQLLSIREHELLFGPSSLLSRFGPLLSEICSQNTTYASPRLQSVATLAMAKFMIVSAAYCERHLPLLITILERSADSITRANVVVALGDMAVSFNQLLDGENTDFLYRRLADTSKLVKRTCLMTLTFLILAGQVKVKGKLGEMAKLVEDEDGRCREMARGFFGELAGKDSAVYNHFVDVFSLLSCGTSALAAAPTPPGTSHGFKSELETVAETGTETETSQLSADGTASEAPQQPQPPPMEPARFQAIIRFLTSFVEKERHAKQLAEKLAGRLGRVESERQWEDVAFALGCLQHRSEEIGRVLADGYRVVGAVGS